MRIWARTIHTCTRYQQSSPPPMPRNHLAQEPPPWFRGRILAPPFLPGYWVFHGSGGCRTAIQVCRTSFHVCCYGSPPSLLWCSFLNVVNCGKGEGAHVAAQRAGKFFFRATGLPTVMSKNQPLVPPSNFGGKACTRTAPWFRGQTLPVPGHGGGGGAYPRSSDYGKKWAGKEQQTLPHSLLPLLELVSGRFGSSCMVLPWGGGHHLVAIPIPPWVSGTITRLGAGGGC